MNEIEKLKTALAAIAADPANAARIAQEALAKPVDHATEIPMNDCGLSINCGRDGTWLHFTASTGLHSSLNIDSMGAEKGNIIGRGLRDWCADRQEQAEQLRADNGQFGVGA